MTDCWALVGTRRFADGYAAFQAFRPRWPIKNDAYRELKEGFGLEEQRWGRDAAAAHCRTARAELGRSPVVLFMDDGYGVLSVEELLEVVGFPARQGLSPALERANRPRGPT